MRKLLTTIFPAILGLCTVTAMAQVPPPPKPPQPVVTQPPVAPCPQIQVQGPNRPMREGEQVGFAVNISGGDPGVQPIYSWAISSGTIIGGQGTRNIAVDSAGTGVDRQITADLLVGGYAPECTISAKATVAVAGPAKKVDEFGDLIEKDEAGKLDSVITYVNQNPDRVYIIGYAGRSNVRGYASNVLRRMRAYIAKSGVTSDRVAAVDGGFREEPTYEFWIVPVGAEAPRPSPTIERKDIVYPKTPPPAPKTPPIKKP